MGQPEDALQWVRLGGTNGVVAAQTNIEGIVRLEIGVDEGRWLGFEKFPKGGAYLRGHQS